jgi:hypothetical protein
MTFEGALRHFPGTNLPCGSGGVPEIITEIFTKRPIRPFPMSGMRKSGTHFSGAIKFTQIA